MKILFLYSELAEYTVSCLNAAISSGQVSELHVVRFPVNPEAPFQFQFDNGIKVYERNSMDTEGLLALCKQITPDKIVCSGWMDKGYLEVCKAWKGKAKTILTLDNHWNGGFKQQLLRLSSRFVLHNRFSHCWVPGELQSVYAHKLGFTPDKVEQGFYAADVSGNNLVFKRRMETFSSTSVPRAFICVARYIPAKGLEYLWDAYIKLKEETGTDWELHCLGTGENYSERKEYAGIKHFGFVQPADLTEKMMQASVFVLPSVFEPWGVVVQEFAAAGFPLLLSSKVGSHSIYLEEGVNGYLFEPSNVEAIYTVLKKITELSDSQLLEMSKSSNTKGMGYQIGDWVDKLLKF